MSKITYDYSAAKDFISADEFKKMSKEAEKAKKTLVSKSGAGNDFLGWVDLPENYDREEFDRIKKAAARIKSDSEVLIVIGIVSGSPRGGGVPAPQLLQSG